MTDPFDKRKKCGTQQVNAVFSVRSNCFRCFGEVMHKVDEIRAITKERGKTQGERERKDERCSPQKKTDKQGREKCRGEIGEGGCGEGKAHSGDDTVESGLEPSDGVLGSDLVLESDSSLLLLPLGDTHTGSAHDDVEVHSEDTDSGVVLDSQVDVLLDTETEVSGLYTTHTQPKGRVVSIA
jgi:hypothetical protein